MSVPTFVASSNGSQTTAGTSLSVNNPAGMSNGDLMIAHVATTGGLVNPPAGWSYVGISRNGAAAAGGSNVYARLASSEPASYTWGTTTSTEWNVIIHAYRPSSGTWASIWDAIISVVWSNEVASSTTLTIPAIQLPSSIDVMAVAFMALGRGSTTTTKPASYTLAENPDSGGTTTSATESAGAYKSITAGTIPSDSFTTTNSGGYTTVHIALKDPGEPVRRLVRNYMPSANGLAGQAASATCDVTRVPGCKAGDLLVAYISSSSSQVMTPPTGWTLLLSDTVSGVNHTGFWYVKTADGTEGGTTITWTRTSGTADYLATIFAISDAPSLPTYTSADDTSSNTTWTFPGLTHAAQTPNAIILIGWTEGSGTALGSGNPAGYTPTASTTHRTGNAAGNVLDQSAYKVETGADPASGSFTGAGSITGTGFMLSTATVSYPPFNEAEMVA